LEQKKLFVTICSTGNGNKILFVINFIVEHYFKNLLAWSSFDDVIGSYDHLMTSLEVLII
jgi:hypothetical protein